MQAAVSGLGFSLQILLKTEFIDV